MPNTSIYTKSAEIEFAHALKEQSSQRKVRPYLNANVLYMTTDYTKRIMDNALSSADNHLVEAIRYMYSIDKISQLILSLDHHQTEWKVLAETHKKRQLADNLTFSNTKKVHIASPSVFVETGVTSSLEAQIDQFKTLVMGQILDYMLDKQVYDEMDSILCSGEYFEGVEATADFNLIANDYFYAHAFSTETIKNSTEQKVDGSATWLESEDERATFYSLKRGIALVEARKEQYYAEWDEQPLMLNVAKENSMNLFVHYGFDYMQEIAELVE